MSKCSVSGCDSEVLNKKNMLCQKHYFRLRRHGDPLAGRSFVYTPSKTHCEFEDCTKEIYAKGFCSAHYTRLLRHGDPSLGGTPQGTPLEWLRSHAGFASDDCLEWPFATARGYGMITMNGHQVVASRVMCEMINGKPPSDNLDCAHSCGNGHLGCVNPRHLRWATRTENHADKVIHGTTQRGDKSSARKICSEDAIKIRGLEGVEPARSLAKRYGISVAMIYKIWRKTAWAYI